MGRLEQPQAYIAGIAGPEMVRCGQERGLHGGASMLIAKKTQPERVREKNLWPTTAMYVFEATEYNVLDGQSSVRSVHAGSGGTDADKARCEIACLCRDEEWKTHRTPETKLATPERNLTDRDLAGSDQ